ncbi:RTC4-like domain-containing protein [Mycena epipterygia]|nr:RTC4-like domain-containing protein [Mycena epipterygia]
MANAGSASPSLVVPQVPGVLRRSLGDIPRDQLRSRGRRDPNPDLGKVAPAKKARSGPYPIGREIQKGYLGRGKKGVFGNGNGSDAPSNMDEEEDMSMSFISHKTDPKTLCPYCDRPLPAEPSATLEALLEQVFLKSYAQPRPSNPNGRTVSLTVFSSLCERHEFESKEAPKGAKEKWPTRIDWEGLPDRLHRMRGELTRILEDEGDRIEYGGGVEATQEVQSPGPWVAGVQGQFATFDKSKTGYYGSKGAEIITQTLWKMFTRASCPNARVDPFTLRDFVERILVPEAAMRLIMEDKSWSVEDEEKKKLAVGIMRDSMAYGTSMFPDE